MKKNNISILKNNLKIKKLKIIKKLKNNLYKFNILKYNKIFYCKKQNKVNYIRYIKSKVHIKEKPITESCIIRQIKLTNNYKKWLKEKDIHDTKIELKNYRKIMLSRDIDTIENFEFDKYILLLENYYDSLKLAFIEYSNYLKKLPKVSDFDSITISKIITRLSNQK